MADLNAQMVGTLGKHELFVLNAGAVAVRETAAIEHLLKLRHGTRRVEGPAVPERVQRAPVDPGNVCDVFRSLEPPLNL